MMKISAVGTTYTYTYNRDTRLLSDPEGDDSSQFVDYFNTGELADNTELNGYDQRTKAELERLLEYDFDNLKKFWGETYDENGNVKVSITIEDVCSTQFCVNDKKLHAMVPVIYTDDEIRQFATGAPEFETTIHKDYNPIDNSINLAIGDSFNYGSGYRFTIMKNGMRGEGYTSDESANAAADVYMGMIATLAHIGDQRFGTFMLDDELTENALKFLRSLGVDTDREFIINGTHLSVRDGVIKEVGNVTGISNSIYNKALKRYEEELNRTLRSS